MKKKMNPTNLQKIFFRCSILLGFVLLITCTPAQAHRLIVFAWVDGDMVHVESKFSGGKAVHEGKVFVYDMKQNLLLKGVTDHKGEFSFKIPQKTPLKIELVASAGHRGEWFITADEIVAFNKKSTQDESGVESDSRTGSSGGDDLEQTPVGNTAVLTREEVRKVVEKTLDEKLKPVMKVLGEIAQPGPTASDILGGIGYIIGLVGIGAYVSCRRKKGEN